MKNITNEEKKFWESVFNDTDSLIDYYNKIIRENNATIKNEQLKPKRVQNIQKINRCKGDINEAKKMKRKIIEKKALL